MSVACASRAMRSAIDHVPPEEEGHDGEHAFDQRLAQPGQLQPAGELHVDSGAQGALKAGKSLLPAGVTEVTGSFGRGDPVAILGPAGQKLGQGLTRYTVAEAEAIRENLVNGSFFHAGADWNDSADATVPEGCAWVSEGLPALPRSKVCLYDTGRLKGEAVEALRVALRAGYSD